MPTGAFVWWEEKPLGEGTCPLRSTPEVRSRPSSSPSSLPLPFSPPLSAGSDVGRVGGRSSGWGCEVHTRTWHSVPFKDLPRTLWVCLAGTRGSTVSDRKGPCSLPVRGSDVILVTGLGNPSLPTKALRTSTDDTPRVSELCWWKERSGGSVAPRLGGMDRGERRHEHSEAQTREQS